MSSTAKAGIYEKHSQRTEPSPAVVEKVYGRKVIMGVFKPRGLLLGIFCYDISRLA